MKPAEFTEADWEALLDAAFQLQQLVPGAVLVGGSAVAARLAHRFSLDADHVLPDLAQRFAGLVKMLEARDDWVTARLAEPNQILGSFRGVETGIRQLVRARPLETEEIEVKGRRIVVPTTEELARIKGWLALRRNRTRDYVDLAVLSYHLGEEGSARAFASFDSYYKDIYRPGPLRDVSPVLQLARQLSDPRPADLKSTPLDRYKGLKPPWNDWSRVKEQCAWLAVVITSAVVAKPPTDGLTR